MYGIRADDNDDRYDEVGEEYPGQRFGFDGWGPTPAGVQEYYDETDPERRRQIAQRIRGEARD